MIKCDFVESKNKKCTIAKFVSDENKSLYSIWAESLFEHAFKILEGTTRVWVEPDDVKSIIYDVLENRKLVGVAKLHDDDTFNREEGIKLARIDLKNRYKQAEKMLERKIVDLIQKDVKMIVNRTSL